MTARLAAFLTLLALPLASCQAAPGRVTSVVGIDLAEGVNTVPRFAPDGREAVIVLAQRQAPSGGVAAPSFVTVLLPRFAPTRGWDVVGVEDAAGTIADGPPLPGIGRARAVRFARAKIGGIPATLMFVATGQAGREPVRITTYRLRTDGDDASGLAAAFAPVSTRVASGFFCSPEAALEADENLDPLPDGSCARS